MGYERKRHWELGEKSSELREKGVGTGRTGGGNWKKKRWKLEEKEVGTGR